MPRPAHVLAVSGALVVAGVLVGGTAYAAASRAQSSDETYVACVDLATGAMRLIDPLAGHSCTTTVGPGQERQISWSRTAGERGPQGPAGPRGPRGEAGEDGADGQLRRLDDLAGVRCTSGDGAGRVEIRVEPPERGSAIQLICMTDDTVAVPPSTVPAPTTTSRPTEADKPTRPDEPTRPTRPTRPPATTAQSPDPEPPAPSDAPAAPENPVEAPPV